MVSLVIPNVVVVVFVLVAFTAIHFFLRFRSFSLSLFSFSTDDHTWLPLPLFLPSPPSFLPPFLPPHWPHPLRSAMDMVEGGRERGGLRMRKRGTLFEDKLRE